MWCLDCLSRRFRDTKCDEKKTEIRDQKITLDERIDIIKENKIDSKEVSNINIRNFKFPQEQRKVNLNTRNKTHDRDITDNANVDQSPGAEHEEDKKRAFMISGNNPESFFFKIKYRIF